MAGVLLDARLLARFARPQWSYDYFEFTARPEQHVPPRRRLKRALGRLRYADGEVRYSKIMIRAADEQKGVVILGLGVGMKTPSILCWHNEDLARLGEGERCQLQGRRHEWGGTTQHLKRLHSSQQAPQSASSCCSDLQRRNSVVPFS
ncbi:hypothetical protein AURDEDRAFT_161674 [Auricularia subglabra TFB-10046 SS5]|nr:hypothetical protein AURDEDRAFT_161674 [Auricularia subglabra TFB-10046 SS5]